MSDLNAARLIGSLLPVLLYRETVSRDFSFFFKHIFIKLNLYSPLTIISIKLSMLQNKSWYVLETDWRFLGHDDTFF